MDPKGAPWGHNALWDHQPFPGRGAGNRRGGQRHLLLRTGFDNFNTGPGFNTGPSLNPGPNTNTGPTMGTGLREQGLPSPVRACIGALQTPQDVDVRR